MTPPRACGRLAQAGGILKPAKAHRTCLIQLCRYCGMPPHRPHVSLSWPCKWEYHWSKLSPSTVPQQGFYSGANPLSDAKIPSVDPSQVSLDSPRLSAEARVAETKESYLEVRRNSFYSVYISFTIFYNVSLILFPYLFFLVFLLCFSRTCFLLDFFFLGRRVPGSTLLRTDGDTNHKYISINR